MGSKLHLNRIHSKSQNTWASLGVFTKQLKGTVPESGNNPALLRNVIWLRKQDATEIQTAPVLLPVF